MTMTFMPFLLVRAGATVTQTGGFEGYVERPAPLST
jgi:hypothetical protein